MDAFAHLRIERGRVRLVESGAGVRIEITGMMINESITIEVGHCQTLEVRPLCMTERKREEPLKAGYHKESDPIPDAPPPAQGGIIGLTARRGHGLGKRNGQQ